MRETLRFCDDRDGLVGSVVDILSDNLYSGSLKDVLIERYARMRENFRDTPCGSADWRQGDLMNDLSSREDLEAATLDVPERFFARNTPMRNLVHTHYNCGTDLPVWIDNGASAFKAMIVGQDPLRNGHCEEGHLFLSSPWGLHSSSFTKCGRTKNVLSRLIHDHCASVYITDYSKLYFSDSANNADPRKARPSFGRRVEKLECCWNPGLFSSIITAERTLFDPDLTIFMGKGILPCVELKWRDDDHRQTEWRIDDRFGRYVTMYHPNAHGIENTYFDNAFSIIEERIRAYRQNGAV